MFAPRRGSARSRAVRVSVVADIVQDSATVPAPTRAAAANPAPAPAAVPVTTPVRARRQRPSLVPVAPGPIGEMTPKIERFLARERPATPCVVVDVDVVAANYRQLDQALPQARIFYAVKANPARAVLERLRDLGSYFDVASAGEIELCLKAGIGGERLSYGSTIKKAADISYAYKRGVRLFAFDSIAELEKIAGAAPGADVFCRMLWECGGAEWPLSRKFGCTPRVAADLLVRARDLGLKPRGISFHVGSQQTDLKQYELALGKVAEIFQTVRAQGIELDLIDIGGGFPSRYQTEVPSINAYGIVIRVAMQRHFGDRAAAITLIAEPGRYIVGDAGVLVSEVVLVSTKDYDEDKRWIFLDVGKFNGLAETMDEAIKYRLRTPHDGGPTGPVVLAGPTCDSADILYEKFNYELPLAVETGDRLIFLSAGAYTTTYASVGFNGFQPIKDYCV